MTKKDFTWACLYVVTAAMGKTSFHVQTLLHDWGIGIIPLHCYLYCDFQGKQAVLMLSTTPIRPVLIITQHNFIKDCCRVDFQSSGFV